MRYDHFSMLPERAFQPRSGRFHMTLEGGSGGGGSAPQPTQTTTIQSTIPEYAQPYMERLLGKAEGAAAAPYQTYGGERLAGTTPLQQQATEQVAGMQMPGQFQTATTGTQAGMGLGLGAGLMGLGTAFTDPTQMMSPYMQGVVDIQKREAITDAQKGQLMQNLGAARQGTYGGARQLLAGTERERALGQQLGDIQARGLQTAYEQASQRGIQLGQLGIQGLGAGLQGAQQLGQLGGMEQQAGLQLAQSKEQMGALEQARQQQALDLAYQDFLAQQRYPYSQLGFMSDILRGSGNLATTGGTALYQAPPTTTQSLMQMGLGGLGLYNAVQGR